MPLEYTSLPPVPRGMNLAGPALFIDEAYCKWMQDVLVDRPGEIRMRGPLTRWVGDNTFSNTQQALGACDTITPAGAWRAAVFATGDSNTTGTNPSANGIVKVFDADKNVIGTITLPFILKTKWNSTTKHWESQTIIDAKPALGGGVWVGVTDGYGVIDGVQALMYWRGAGKATYSEASRTYTRDSKNITLSNVGNVEPGMFVFDITNNTGTSNTDNGNGRYLGVVSAISGSDVILEKEVLITHTATASYTGRTLEFRSFRGFIHQHGRGLGSTDGGQYITSGRLGSDAEGFFKAARVTIGNAGGQHRNIAYRSSDHQYIGRITYEGIVSNIQVQMTDFTTDARDFLEDDNYFILRDDYDMVLSGDTVNDTKKYSMLATNRVYDSRPFLTPSGAGGSYTPFPGVFNSTYAGRQWFASVGNTAIKSDQYVNRVVFSGLDNPENINLAPDASDSITIPGREAIRGIAGSVSGLLVFVENKTYIIKGTRRDNFSLEELYPDGTLCTSSIVQVGGGVIWTGKQGIYYYDGVTVRNFTKDTLGIYYTDGIHQFNSNKDRVYSFVFNNYLVINFTQWDSSYTISRWESIPANQVGEGSGATIRLTNDGQYTRIIPTSITFSIFLPTGSIGTLSNFTPRGFITTTNLSSTKGLMVMNRRATSDTTGAPTENRAQLLDLSTLFTEEINQIVLDDCRSNDANPSSAGIVKAGPDFFLESKQYNFDESTLRKWWRKMMFNLRINNGFMMVEFVDINNQTLVDTVTNQNYVQNTDESGYFLIPSTSLSWDYYENLSIDWQDIESSGLTWGEYFGNKIVRYSKWIGIRQNSLGFKFYSLREYRETRPSGMIEVVPELVGINDWVFGLKPLRKGRN